MNYLWTSSHSLIMMLQSMADCTHDDVPTLPNGSVSLICISILRNVHTVTKLLNNAVLRSYLYH